ncbi:ornithine cyclodeaminase family protein [Enemella sp. A6]|uniref:ornithine cyclodeaminase family protein n=1 Tax=Enemella sp. A6 TaxID=3440152 RepID=UPI003EBDB12F
MAAPDWIDADQVRARMSPDRARRLLHEALVSGFDPADDPPRTATPAGAGHFLLMPSTVGELSGVKVLSVAPGNPDLGLPRIQGLYVLLDAATLTPTTLIDAASLTHLRTPAVSMVGVDALCAEQVDTVVFIGSGPQTVSHAEALLAIRRPRRALLHSRDTAHASAAAQQVTELGLPCAAVARDGLAEAVGAADLVVICTSASEPVIDGSWVADGACVVAIGAHEPDKRELDAALVGRSLVVVEETDTALREAGDVVLAIEDGTLHRGDLHTMRQLVLGEVSRATDRPNVFKTVGMGWQDLVVASGVALH